LTIGALRAESRVWEQLIEHYNPAFKIWRSEQSSLGTGVILTINVRTPLSAHTRFWRSNRRESTRHSGAAFDLLPILDLGLLLAFQGRPSLRGRLDMP
jgi:hypothetical protein